MNPNKLEWEEKYSVGVSEIDLQHQTMFVTINQLIDIINTHPTPKKINEIITSLLAYKKFHFATEEKYFKKFSYSGAKDHVNAHQQFSQKLEALSQTFSHDTLAFAYELIDFLEDWLIDHLLTVDQEYKECFSQHGLK